MTKCSIFPDFIDEIGCFGMYLGRRCSCFWVKVRRNDAILRRSGCMNRCGRAAMGLFSEEVTRGFYNFRREIGHISQRVYVAVWENTGKQALRLGLLVEQG